MNNNAKWYSEWVRLLPAMTADEKMRNLEAADLILNMAAELEQVKQERDGLSIMLTSATSAAETYKRERDAAVYDLRNFSLNVCMTCNRSTNLNECEVFGKGERPEDEFIGLCGQYEWRGLCKENGGST